MAPPVSIGVSLSISSLGVVSAAAFANGEAAPAGYHWEFVYDDTIGDLVTDDATGQPVVDLVVNS